MKKEDWLCNRHKVHPENFRKCHHASILFTYFFSAYLNKTQTCHSSQLKTQSAQSAENLSTPLKNALLEATNSTKDASSAVSFQHWCLFFMSNNKIIFRYVPEVLRQHKLRWTWSWIVLQKLPRQKVRSKRLRIRRRCW